MCCISIMCYVIEHTAEWSTFRGILFFYGFNCDFVFGVIPGNRLILCASFPSSGFPSGGFRCSGFSPGICCNRFRAHFGRGCRYIFPSAPGGKAEGRDDRAKSDYSFHNLGCNQDAVRMSIGFRASDTRKHSSEVSYRIFCEKQGGKGLSVFCLSVFIFRLHNAGRKNFSKSAHDSKSAHNTGVR